MGDTQEIIIPSFVAVFATLFLVDLFTVESWHSQLNWKKKWIHVQGASY